MRKKILLTTLLITMIGFVYGQKINSNFRILDNENGLSQATVTAMLQDSQGFIWFGTTDGLNKYDGHKFTVYNHVLGDTNSLLKNQIIGLAQDKDDNIWILSLDGVSKFNPKTEKFRNYSNGADDSLLVAKKALTYIYIDSKNRVWVSHSFGLDLYNSEKDVFEKVFTSVFNETDVYADEVGEIKEDKNGNLWLAMPFKGVTLFNPESKKIQNSYKLLGDNSDGETETAWQILIDDNNTLWIRSYFHDFWKFNLDTDQSPIQIKASDVSNINRWHSFLGKTNSGKIIIRFFNEELGLFDPFTGKIESFFNAPSFMQGVKFISFLEDSSGSIWLGTDMYGVIYSGANDKPFRYEPNLTNSDYKLPEAIYEMFGDSKGNVWSEDGKFGLLRINPKTGTRRTYPELFDHFKRDSHKSKVIRNIIEDTRGQIWILSMLYDLVRLDPESGRITVFKDLKSGFSENRGLRSEIGLSSKEGHVWIVNLVAGELVALDEITGEVKKRYLYSGNSKADSLKLPFRSIFSVIEDEQGNLLMGFMGGGVYKLDKDTDVFTKIVFDVLENDINLSSLSVLSLYKNQRDILWMGTGKGLVRYNVITNKATRYGVEDGLPNNTIYEIIDDGLGNLWLTTNKGISRLNLETTKFSNYDASDGLNQTEFSHNASFKSQSSDFIYLAGTKGYSYFNPKEIKENPYIPEIIITSFKRNDGESGFREVPGINYVSNITLTYSERDFSVQFAALDYTNPAKNEYAYRLEGYNKDWIEIGNEHSVTFTSLSPGSYILHLKGSNNDRVWNDTGKSLKINILSPWWGSWWAYTLYGLFVIGLLYGIYRFHSNQQEKLRLKELDETKRRMYTNITHEFRTPLTVISGINQELKEHFVGEKEDNFELIERNSQNLLYLINQILELTKIEIGKAKVDYIQDDVVSYIKYIGESFNTYAETKEINYHFISAVSSLQMDYDPEKILVVLSNLLSNAIKYNEKGGNIYLQVQQNQDKLQVMVTDSGGGIPEKELPHIFERFYKSKDKRLENIDGMGVGLAVAKEFVSLMGGTIKAGSKLGQGSVFTIELPITQNAPLGSSPEQGNEEELLYYFNSNSLVSNTVAEELVIDAVDRPTVLVIEDNADIVTYMKQCLQDQWEVAVSYDGKAGIEKAQELVPDIILSDLMMPNANGFEVLASLKNIECTSHIPIVLLTANAEEVSRLEAYRLGADSYLMKPFDKTELLLILKKLVDQRAALQKRYRNENPYYDSLGTIPRKEDDFIGKIENLILDNLMNASYGIKALCQDLGIGRTQLHNKLKALTGISTSHFIRSVRLKKARYMLEYSDLSVSEIAYDVGFNHASYFTKSFIKEFGIAPSSLKK